MRNFRAHHKNNMHNVIIPFGMVHFPSPLCLYHTAIPAALRNPQACFIMIYTFGALTGARAVKAESRSQGFSLSVEVPFYLGISSFSALTINAGKVGDSR